MAENAGAIGERERHDHKIAALDLADCRAHIFYHPDCFVTHQPAAIGAFQLLIRPQIAPANAGTSDANDCVSWVDDFRVRHVLNPNVTSFIHHSCTHNDLPPVCIALRFVAAPHLRFSVKKAVSLSHGIRFTRS